MFTLLTTLLSSMEMIEIMTDQDRFTLRWGVMATGHVAGRFTRDLLTNPASRGVHDVRHEVTAIASSTSLSKAASFRDDVKIPGNVRLYASYAELVRDSNVDIVYIATPARALVAFARAKGVFLMEAVWTRFFPLSIRVRELVCSDAIGPVHRVIGGANNEDIKLHRLLKLDIAGGAMLDLGIYSLTWIMQILYHLQSKGQKQVPVVVSAVNKYPSGVDEMSTFVLQFPRQKAMGVGMASLRIVSGVDFDFTAGPPVRIQGSAGEIQVFGPAFKPNRISIITSNGSGPASVKDEAFPIPKDEARNDWGHGLFWEADECARCIRDGRLESTTLPLDESVLMMEIMEGVLKEGAVQHPDSITDDVYRPS